MSKKTKSSINKIETRKNAMLGVAMLLFAAAYPLTYLSAESGWAPAMTAALIVTSLGSLLAAIL